MDEEEHGPIQTPPELHKIAGATSLNLLPEKSKAKYLAVYEKFMTWRSLKKAPITENVMLVYFDELSKCFKPPSLWSIYSMLKSTLQINDKIDISKFPKLFALIKRLNEGYVPNKAEILTEAEIEKFLNEAPDQIFLAAKVCIPTLCLSISNTSI